MKYINKVKIQSLDSGYLITTIPNDKSKPVNKVATTNEEDTANCVLSGILKQFKEITVTIEHEE